MKRRFDRLSLWLFVFFVFFASVEAQSVKPSAKGDGRQFEFRLSSKLMGREMPYRVIVPKSYAAQKPNSPRSEARFPVVYLLHGLTGHFDNWTDKTELAKFSESFDFIIVTPEGGDGWYSDSATVTNDKYESYIVKELIPEIDARYPTLTNREGRFIAGLSMGGYGALKFGLKYPDKFAAAGSFSGALRATDWTDKMIGEWLAKSIMSVFGAAESENRKANDIYLLARGWPAEQIKELPFLYIDCGTEDFLIENSHEFAKVLREKKIPHEFRELPGKHDWVYWNSQVQEFLRLADRMSAKPQAKAAKSTN